MKHAYVVVVGTLCWMAYTANVVYAEGEVPTTPPTTAGLVAPTANENTVVSSEPLNSEPLNSEPLNSEPLNSEPAGNVEPTENAKPDPETWRPIVDNLRPGYWETSNLPVQGVAMYYNPGVFQKVLGFRYKNQHISTCDECIGYVALLRAGDLDRRVWLQRQDRIAEGPFWVVDVASRRDIPGLLERNWVVDIDYQTAMRWRMAGPIPITVYDADSPIAREFAQAYFSSEMIPHDERHFIPPEAYSYREPDDEPDSDSADAPTISADVILNEYITP